MTRLQGQLREAAEREASAGALAHTLRVTRWRVRSPELAAVLAVAVFAIAVAAAVFALGGEETTPTGPIVVAELELTGNPETIVPAFGSLWIADTLAGDLVHVDPQARKVVARIPIGDRSALGMARVGSEIWVPGEQGTRVLRIDPATDAVTARFPLRTPGGRPFSAFEIAASDRAVWALAPEGALRLNPRTGAGTKLVARSTPAAEAQGFALDDDTLWVLDTSFAIRRFDAVTGAPRGRLQPALSDTGLIVSLGRDLLALNSAQTELARLDGTSGRVIWQRRVGDRVNWFDLDGALLWTHSTTAGRADRLTAIALADGKPVRSIALQTFGSSGLALVGPEIWINTPGGKTVVVRRQPTR